MAGLIEDLLAGLPQAYSTLEGLLAQSKLGRQHYGPRDSMIASAIAHPIEGAQKAGQWLQDQMMTAGQAPMQPMTDPRGAEATSSAGLNLAGLMQTGGIPVAPNEPGVLGTIRGSNINDTLHHPLMQQYLKDMSHNGLRNWDMLGRGEIREEGLKYKVPAKVIKLINKYKDN